MARRKNPEGNPTIGEIAKACGVSSSTVSRALCNRPRVAAEVRERILAEAKRRNYQSGSYKRQGRILVIAGSGEWMINGVYYHDMINSLNARLSAAGFTVIVISENSLNNLGDLYFDGGIALSVNPQVAVEWAAHFNLPLILLNNHPAIFSENFYSIQTDEQEIMDRVLEMLVRKRHERIGILLTGGDNHSNRIRERCFLAAAKAQRISASCFVENDYEQSYFNALGQLIHRGITTLICPAESHWSKIVHALWLFKVNIPQDLSLVVWEGAAPMEYHTPPLTAIQQDFAAFADCCCEIMQKCMAGTSARHEYVVRAKLIERESVRQRDSGENAGGARNGIA